MAICCWNYVQGSKKKKNPVKNESFSIYIYKLPVTDLAQLIFSSGKAITKLTVYVTPNEGYFFSCCPTSALVIRQLLLLPVLHYYCTNIFCNLKFVLKTLKLNSEIIYRTNDIFFSLTVYS